MTTSARQMPAESASSLVGRDEAVARVLAGVQPPYVDGQAVLIEGPAGIGKTSLLRAGVSKAEAAGATVLYARPVETEANYAYATLGDLLGPRLASIRPRPTNPICIVSPFRGGTTSLDVWASVVGRRPPR